MKVFKRIYYWFDERVEINAYIKKNVLDKPIPRGLNLGFCFGGITFFLFLMLAATGYFLTIYYVPTPDHAHGAVDYITNEVSMGGIIRSVHYWSANLMIVTIFLHTLRVFIYGSYKRPRELTWISGVLLFAIVLAFGFTGYFLPWDQKAYWATEVGTSIMGTIPVIGQYFLKVIRGGEEISALTLIRFYALHVFFLPILTVFLLIGHFSMIRRQGISTPL